VLFYSLSRFASVAVVLAISAAAAGAWPHKQGPKAQIRFLAASTLVRGTWGWNEDIYFAELMFLAVGAPLLLRLIDAYPNEAPPSSQTVLTAPSETMLKVCRDTGCDFPYGQMILRTAPGDPIAILPERLGYWPQLTRTAAPDELLLQDGAALTLDSFAYPHRLTSATLPFKNWLNWIPNGNEFGHRCTRLNG
jgi:hypothetical protein